VRGKGAAGSGLGLQNTKARLNYLYSDEASLSFTVTGEIADAILLFPALESTKAKFQEAPVPELKVRSA
jgi:hypothetical protein